MPEYDPVTKISIVPRGAAGGLTFFAPSEERLESGLYSRTYLENQMCVALGGRIAEELIFGDESITTGASSDFQQVCTSLTRWLCVWVLPPRCSEHCCTSAWIAQGGSVRLGLRCCCALLAGCCSKCVTSRLGWQCALTAC
jgi:cell division protease FtsH